MIDKCKYLTPSDTRYISQIAGDLQSGNHLLHPRDDKYWDFFYEMTRARTKEAQGHAMTWREQEMCEYERQCSDYFYWKHLPQEKKLFIEENEDGEWIG